MNPIIRGFTLVYNAVFTKYGRRNVIYRFRKWKLNAFSNWDHEKNPVVYRLKNGMRFVVHPADNLSMDIYLNGEHETEETAFIRSVLREGDHVLDIGANVGYYTATFSFFVGSAGKVISVEPGPRTFRKLQETKQLLSLQNALLIESAVGEKSGTCKFTVSTVGRDAQQSVHKWSGLIGDYQQIDVSVCSIDDIVSNRRDFQNKMAMMKCDVEGYEYNVLLGAASVLGSEHPPLLLLEINKPALAANGTQLKQVFELLGNYHLYQTPPNRHNALPIRLTEDSLESLPEISNCYAIPKQGLYASRIIR